MKSSDLLGPRRIAGLLKRRRFQRWVRREIQPERFAAFGAKSLIVPPAVIRGHENISIGDDTIIHHGATLSVVSEVSGQTFQPSLRFGDGVRIGCFFVVACCGEIEIGDEVLAADRVFVGDTYHAYAKPDVPVIHQGMAEPKPVRIGRGSFLGVNSTILPGVTLGENAYVAASAVVTKDVPPRSIVAGNPARVVKEWDGESWTLPRQKLSGG